MPAAAAEPEWSASVCHLSERGLPTAIDEREPLSGRSLLRLQSAVSSAMDTGNVERYRKSLLRAIEHSLDLIEREQARVRLKKAQGKPVKDRIWIALHKKKTMTCRDIQMYLPKQARVSAPMIKQAMQELVDSGRAVWADENNKVLGLPA
jgi:hypothetical protein